MPAAAWGLVGQIQFQRESPKSVSCLALPSSGGKLSEFRSVYHVGAKGNSPSFSQNSPSLPQDSVSSLFRNSTLEAVFRPFPSLACDAFACDAKWLAIRIERQVSGTTKTFGSSGKLATSYSLELCKNLRHDIATLFFSPPVRNFRQ